MLGIGVLGGGVRWSAVVAFTSGCEVALELRFY